MGQVPITNQKEENHFLVRIQSRLDIVRMICLWFAYMNANVTSCVFLESFHFSIYSQLYSNPDHCPFWRQFNNLLIDITPTPPTHTYFPLHPLFSQSRDFEIIISLPATPALFHSFEKLPVIFKPKIKFLTTAIL